MIDYITDWQFTRVGDSQAEPVFVSKSLSCIGVPSRKRFHRVAAAEYAFLVND